MPTALRPCGDANERPVFCLLRYGGEHLSKYQSKEQRQLADIPKWSTLLVEAVNKPGLIIKHTAPFWNYSVGNQILALGAMPMRGIQPGPINTF